ncbi:hypothetical protein FB446DRAFT_429194 [Lentinula raphanica]|nr:hypothetical protein FB446DRAFT_429194 [Lentinula raphanica]
MFSILSLSHHPRSGSRVHGLVILLVLGLVSLACAGPIQARSERDGVNLPNAELNGMPHPPVGAGVSSVQTQNAPPPSQPANLPLAAIRSQEGPYHLVFQPEAEGIRNPEALEPIKKVLADVKIEINGIEGVPTEFGDKSSIRFQLKDQEDITILRGNYRSGPQLFISVNVSSSRKKKLHNLVVVKGEDVSNQLHELSSYFEFKIQEAAVGFVVRLKLKLSLLCRKVKMFEFEKCGDS